MKQNVRKRRNQCKKYVKDAQRGFDLVYFISLLMQRAEHCFVVSLTSFKIREPFIFLKVFLILFIVLRIVVYTGRLVEK